MTLKEFDKVYKSKKSFKEKTRCFNELSVNERKVFLDGLNEGKKQDFISKIRTQAVKDFWTHEQALIKNGECTRDWMPDQTEEILNISEETSMYGKVGGVTFDAEGQMYYGHHMANVIDYPEYAGDWRLIQALTRFEHYYGAYENLLKNSSVYYYNPDTCQRYQINL